MDIKCLVKEDYKLQYMKRREEVQQNLAVVIWILSISVVQALLYDCSSNTICSQLLLKDVRKLLMEVGAW